MATLPSSRPLTPDNLIDRVGREAEGGVAVLEPPAELLVEVPSVQSVPDLSKRCPRSAMTRATMPPYTTKTWLVIAAAAPEAR